MQVGAGDTCQHDTTREPCGDRSGTVTDHGNVTVLVHFGDRLVRG